MKSRRAQNLIEEIESQSNDFLEQTLKDLDDESFDRDDYALRRVRRAMERRKDDLSNPRSRLQLQLVGAKNWNMTSAEVGRINSLARNREIRKQASSRKQKRWLKIVENASEETKRVIEFAELLEGTRLGGINSELGDEDDDEEEDADNALDHSMKSQKSKRRNNRNISEDHNDWSIGSRNRRKQMYPHMHNEEERNRVGCVGRGSNSTRKFELSKSQFLDARIDDDYYVQSKWRPSTRVRRVLEQTAVVSSATGSSSTPEGDSGKESKEKQDKGLPKDPNDWDTKAVCRFLNRKGWGKFLKFFSDANIDGPALLRLTPIDMDEFEMSRTEAAEFIQLTGSLK